MYAVSNSTDRITLQEIRTEQTDGRTEGHRTDAVRLDAASVYNEWRGGRERRDSVRRLCCRPAYKHPSDRAVQSSQ